MSTKKRAKTHKDVEFHVDDAGGHTRIFKHFDQAAGFALALALSGRDARIDTVVYSRAGARWLEGDYGVEQYDEDPEATVFKRIRVRADDLGRVP